MDQPKALINFLKKAYQIQRFSFLSVLYTCVLYMLCLKQVMFESKKT